MKLPYSISTNPITSSQQKFSVEFSSGEPFPGWLFHMCEIKTFALNISGEINSESNESEWHVNAEFIEENNLDYSTEPEGAICFFFTNPAPSLYKPPMNIRLAIRTNVDIVSYQLPINENEICIQKSIREDGNNLFSSTNLDVIPPEDIPFVMGDSLPSNSENNIINSETVNYVLNPETACTGFGIQIDESHPKKPYPGNFLGVRILYDATKGEILQIDTDIDGKADWYASHYQVIIYPCEPMLCPTITVAVCVWSTHIGDTKGK